MNYIIKISWTNCSYRLVSCRNVIWEASSWWRFAFYQWIIRMLVAGWKQEAKTEPSSCVMIRTVIKAFLSRLQKIQTEPEGLQFPLNNHTRKHSQSQICDICVLQALQITDHREKYTGRPSTTKGGKWGVCGGVVAARLLRLNRSPCRGERCCWCTCSSLVTLFSRRCVMHSRHTLWASFPFTLLFFFSCLCSCFQLMPPHLPVCRSTRRWKKKLAGSDQTTLSIYFSAVLTSENKALMWHVWVFDIPSAMGVF